MNRMRYEIGMCDFHIFVMEVMNQSSSIVEYMEDPCPHLRSKLAQDKLSCKEQRIIAYIGPFEAYKRIIRM